MAGYYGLLKRKILSTQDHASRVLPLLVRCVSHQLHSLESSQHAIQPTTIGINKLSSAIFPKKGKCLPPTASVAEETNPINTREEKDSILLLVEFLDGM